MECSAQIFLRRHSVVSALVHAYVLSLPFLSAFIHPTHVNCRRRQPYEARTFEKRHFIKGQCATLRFRGNYSFVVGQVRGGPSNSGIVLIFCRRLAVRDTAGMLANFSFSTLRPRSFRSVAASPLSFRCPPGKKGEKGRSL